MEIDLELWATKSSAIRFLQILTKEADANERKKLEEFLNRERAKLQLRKGREGQFRNPYHAI